MFNTVFLPYYLTFCLETNESFLNTTFFSLSNQKYFSTFNCVPYLSEKSFHKRSMVISSAARWMSRPLIRECPSDYHHGKIQTRDHEKSNDPEPQKNTLLVVFQNFIQWPRICSGGSIFHRFPLNLTQKFFGD